MSGQEYNPLLHNPLLDIQLFVGLWQILSYTLVGALLVGMLRSCLAITIFSPFPYADLRRQGIRGFIFKEVCCVGLTKAADHRIVPCRISHDISDIKYQYLGKNFHLQRKGLEGNMLFVNGCMKYYITDKIWNSLLEMANMSRETVFVKHYKRIWMGVATGTVMTLHEVMDSLILDNAITMHLNQFEWHDCFLPINLFHSAYSAWIIPKVLNLLAIYFRAKNAYSLITIALTFYSAILELALSFSTKVNALLNAPIHLIVITVSFFTHLILYLLCDKMICRLMHWIRNHIPDSVKMKLYYSFRYFVDEELPHDRKSGNDICAIIGGGAKSPKGDATLVPWLCLSSEETQRTFKCDPISIHCKFQPGSKFQPGNKCNVSFKMSKMAPLEFDMDCNWNEFVKLVTLLDCIKEYPLGSLKSYDPLVKPSHSKLSKLHSLLTVQRPYNMVHTRTFRESIMCYVQNGYPPLYRLHLQNVHVEY